MGKSNQILRVIDTCSAIGSILVRIGHTPPSTANSLFQRTIAKHLDGSHDSINRFVLNLNPIKQKKKTGPAPKLNSRARRSVTRVASNSMKSCNDINQELNLRVSKWTVWRALKENPNITRAVMRPAPRLTNVHKARRLDFARRNMSTNWEKLQ
uniref:HTH_Tnp_Tc3_2 domain-containing protein n=1 Tax=Caenorhabditis japonica TaxID=281687 RepID=A0A8R1HXT3_CAEJA